jgi:uncharacterized delta-60 repeat protein
MKKLILYFISLLIPLTGYSVAGALDYSFDPGKGPNDEVRVIAVQKDGKILIGGSFTEVDGIKRTGLARLHRNGKPDTSFKSGLTNLWGSVIDIAIQEDGRILIGGWFNSYDGYDRNGIARINTDGSLDTTFNPGTGTSGVGGHTEGVPVHSISIQCDGKIIIGGAFRRFNNFNLRNIARLNPDGSVDTTFNPGSGAAKVEDWIENVKTTSIQKDGKIIIGGAFEAYNDSARFNFARLNQDGSLDVTFDPDFNSGWVYSSAIQNDGKILIAGFFRKIYSFNTDGSIDTTFDTGMSDSVNFVDAYSIDIQPNGKVLASGWFKHDYASFISRMNTDGTLDSTFNHADIPNYPARALALQHDGKILIGGVFTKYGDTSVNRIVRIEGDCETGSFLKLDACDGFLSPGGKVNWTECGIYTDTILNHNACDSIITVKLSITSSPDTSIIKENFQLKASDTSANYQWVKCHESFAIVPGANSRSFTPESDGSYAVVLTKNNCTDTSACYSISGLGFDEAESIVNFKIYPNPNTGKFNLSWDNSAKEVHIRILNQLGQKVYDAKVSDNKHQIDLNVPSGLYFIKVSSGQGKLMRAFVIN